MNINLVAVGASRVGKTLFCINFAEYLGAKNLCYTENGPLGRNRGVVLPHDARNLMVHPGPRCNGVVRTFAVNLPLGNPRRIALVDTASLKAKTPLPRSERVKLILTLQALEEANAVLYLVDLSCGDPAHLDFAMEAGLRLADLCRRSAKPFFTLGSKCDLAPSARDLLRVPFSPGGKLIPVSSLTREGFPQLRKRLLDETPLDDIWPG